MKIEMHTSAQYPNSVQFTALLERVSDKVIADEADKLLHEIAKRFVAENQDKILAKLDLSGIANLIAIYASKKLAEDIKK